MFSKHACAAILAVVISLLSACVPVGEEPPPTPDLSKGIQLNMECFADTAKILDAFIKGSATEFQLQEFWTCNSKAISEFEKNTRGRFEDRFTSRELANFVERYFLIDGTKISDGLLRQIFLLKRIFVGGTADSISRKEMMASIEVIKDLRKISLQINPYMKIYSFNWKPQSLDRLEGLRLFAQAEKAIQDAATKLAPLMIRDYDLNEIIVLAREIDEFGKANTRTEFSKMAKQLIPVLIATKNIIFKESGSTVSQWKDFLSISTQFYSRYGYFDYFVKSDDVMSGAGLTALNNLVHDSLAFTESLLERKNLSGVIPLADLTNLWQALLDAGLLPADITVPSLSQVTKTLVKKVFLPPALRVSGYQPDGIVKETLLEMRREFSYWYQAQAWVDSQFSSLPPGVGISQEDMYAAVKNAMPSQGINELSLLLKTPEAISFDSENRIFLGRQSLPYSPKALGLLNVSRSLVRLGMRGYSADHNRAHRLQGLTLAEAESLFTDFRSLMIELKMIDPKDDKFGADRFRDANLFTAHANGNEMLSFGEGANLFVMLGSGIKIDAAFKKNLEIKCPMNRLAAYKGDWLVDVPCALDHYKTDLPKESSSMPELLTYLGKLNKKDYEEVVFGFMRGAGHSGGKNGLMDLATLGQVPQVMQYVEQTYHRFDTDKNGLFSTEEALRAYPVFEKILTKFSGLKTEKENLAVFGYMLKFGHAPVSIIDKGWFALVWVNKDPAKDWELAADRLKVIEILAFISKANPTPLLF
jgi:hypothetical protein